MPNTITFKGHPSIECDSVISYDSTSYSSDDVLKTAMRPCIDIRFPTTVDQHTLTEIFTSKDGSLSEIAINRIYPNPQYVDKETTPDIDETLTESYIHSDYNIPVKLSLEYVDDNMRWVMTLAQLTEIDKALREIAGKTAKKTEFLTFEEYQNVLIEKSNNDLASFLLSHPLVSSCHEGIYQRYNATLNHQFLFTSNYMSHFVKIQAGIDDTFRWNVSGETCEPWTDVEAILFITDMAAYVTPLVEAQQNYEKNIRRAKTKEELDKIVINYSAVPTVNKPISVVGYRDENWIGFTVNQVPTEDTMRI